MATTTLRDLIADKIDHRWQEWASAHPNLAAVLDRTELVDSTVQRLRDDTDFRDAMRAADLDEAKLAAAARILEQAERWITRFMPL